MELCIFAVFDSGISTWMPPIYARNKGEMLRSFMEAVNNPDSKLFKYPGDFTLFDLGIWDDDSCEFKLKKTPERVALAIEYLNKREPVQEKERVAKNDV